MLQDKSKHQKSQDKIKRILKKLKENLNWQNVKHLSKFYVKYYNIDEVCATYCKVIKFLLREV